MENNLNHWIIYMYTFPNGKRYIGKTKCSLRKRQGQNFKRYENCTLLWNAIQKYGEENITQEILFENDMTDEYASRLEQICILLFKTNCNKFCKPKYGYNLTDGGDGMSGWKPDAERYEQLVEQMHSFNEKRRGTHHTDSTKKKMSDAKKGVNNPNYGKCRSDETKKKISIANSKENMSEETKLRRSKAVKKVVEAINITTREKLIFESLEEAASYFNVSGATMSRWAHGLRNPNNGYEFKIYPRTTTKRESVA